MLSNVCHCVQMHSKRFHVPAVHSVCVRVCVLEEVRGGMQN